MTIDIIAFGIIKDILRGAAITIVVEDRQTVAELKTFLGKQYPELEKLTSFMIAVNNEYANPDDVITPNDEIALIPPVSGG